jgi:uncharacterized delta-60 repeat protein
MRSRQKRLKRHFIVEYLEVRSLLSGGLREPTPLPAGSLDPNFGSGGIASSSILGPTSDLASGVAIQRQGDGKIVVAGTARGVQSQSSFALARFNADSSLDKGFGNGGTVFTGFVAGSFTATASAVAIEPDGKIVVVGTVEGDIAGNNVEDFALARYNTDGSLDTSFGTNGEVLTDFGPDTVSSATGIAIAGNGNIVVTGTTTINGTSEFGVARYNNVGSLDQSFGAGGLATVDFGPDTSVFTANGVALEPQGQIVLGGTVAHFTGGFTVDFGVMRFNADGSLDQSFGTGGLVDTSFGSSNAATVAGIALEPGTGAIVLAGTVQDPSFTENFALARYNASDGRLDTNFGMQGEVITPSAPATTSTAAGLAIQPTDGAIVVTGTTSGFDINSNFFQDLVLTRYHSADGSLDQSFGTAGVVFTDFGAGSRTTAAGVAIQSTGKIIAAGSVTFTSGGTVAGFGVARYTSNGILDGRFGTGGKVITNVAGPSSDLTAAEAIQPDGKIVVVGTATVFGPDGAFDEEFALTRFNSDGSVDTHFGSNGSVLTDFGTGTNEAADVVIEPNGKILVAGTVEGTINGEFVQDFALAQYNSDGSLDRRFGSGGVVLTAFGPDSESTAASMALQSNGKIVVVGTASGFDSDDNEFQNFALARYNSNGSLDSSFGTGGKLLTSFGADTPVTAVGVAIQPNGAIIVAGSANDPDTFNDEFALARYSKNGGLDASFGTGGLVTMSFGADDGADIGGVALETNGRIIVAGNVEDFDNETTDFTLVSFNPDGSLDQGFGTGGVVTTDFGSETQAFAAGVVIQPDGKIVVAGTVTGFDSNFNFIQDFAAVRYNTDGSLDQSFGNGGTVLTSTGASESDSAADVAIAPNGNIIVAGTMSDSNSSDFTLVSYVGKKQNRRG